MTLRKRKYNKLLKYKDLFLQAENVINNFNQELAEATLHNLEKRFNYEIDQAEKVLTIIENFIRISFPTFKQIKQLFDGDKELLKNLIENRRTNNETDDELIFALLDGTLKKIKSLKDIKMPHTLLDLCLEDQEYLDFVNDKIDADWDSLNICSLELELSIPSYEKVKEIWQKSKEAHQI